MSEYIAARSRTRAKIERAFWDLYLEKKFRRVTVLEIVQRAGIHRSTFYIYYQSVEDIFSAIKERQLSPWKNPSGCLTIQWSTGQNPLY